jgi:dihydroorotase
VVERSNILAKCGWSPFEGQKFQSKVISTWINGNLSFNNEKVIEGQNGQRLLFDSEVGI